MNMTRTTKQSWWMRAFLAFFVFQMALVLPITTQANILDIIGKLGKAPPTGAGTSDARGRLVGASPANR